MALITHKIGSFPFVNMSPVPPNPKRRLMIETRAGVDGHAVWYDGTRGEIWTPRTVANFPSHAFARVQKQLYEAAIGQRLSIIYADDASYNPVVVQDVQCEIIDQAGGVGGLITPLTTRALLRADWTLLIV